MKDSERLYNHFVDRFYLDMVRTIENTKKMSLEWYFKCYDNLLKEVKVELDKAKKILDSDISEGEKVELIIKISRKIVRIGRRWLKVKV